MKERIVLIGAGSASFTRGLLADIIQRGEETELALVDIDPEALAIAEGLARRMITCRQAPMSLTASTDRREVLPGATVVISTIGVGGRRAWEQDVFIPRKYGIFQPVGDSVMPGSCRSIRLRALPLHAVPAGLVGTLATRLAWVETVVEAVLEGSRDKVI
ncbi:MAG: family 4 glycosyl hydrolase [Armatimonadota bacterium]